MLIQHSFTIDKRESTGALVRRVQREFMRHHLTPGVRFQLADPPMASGHSAIDEAVSRFPDAARCRTHLPFQPPALEGTTAELPFEVLVAIVDGMPRSLPFAVATVRFVADAFGDPEDAGVLADALGLVITDMAWAGGRKRTMTSTGALRTQRSPEQLPELPEPLPAIVAALRPATRTYGPGAVPIAPSSSRAAIGEVVTRFSQRERELVAQAELPHDLPARADSFGRPMADAAPALKAELERGFAPLGYTCSGGPRRFALRRRAATNHVLELEVEVGRWNRMVTATYAVLGPDLRAALAVPATAAEGAHQYPVADAAQWARIVANYAAFVTHLERTFVPAVVAVAGPAPDWYGR